MFLGNDTGAIEGCLRLDQVMEPSASTDHFKRLAGCLGHVASLGGSQRSVSQSVGFIGPTPAQRDLSRKRLNPCQHIGICRFFGQPSTRVEVRSRSFPIVGRRRRAGKKEVGFRPSPPHSRLSRQSLQERFSRFKDQVGFPRQGEDLEERLTYLNEQERVIKLQLARSLQRCLCRGQCSQAKGATTSLQQQRCCPPVITGIVG
jgi:hypothetical protein